MANPFCIGSKGKSQVYSLFCIAFVFLIVVVGAVALYSIPVQDSAEQPVYQYEHPIGPERPGDPSTYLSDYSEHYSHNRFGV